MKPLRDWPALLAGFAALGVGLGGILVDRYALGSSGLWSPFAFLVVLGFFVLTGIDPRTVLGWWNNRGKQQ